MITLSTVPQLFVLNNLSHALKTSVSEISVKLQVLNMKLIILTAVFACFAARSSSEAQIQTSGLLQAEEYDCPTGVRLVENECNPCFCTKEGELACTMHECPENKGKGLENCNLDTSWQKGCNKCWCIPIGEVCTNKSCNN